jgi:hypothetical protein
VSSDPACGLLLLADARSVEDAGARARLSQPEKHSARPDRHEMQRSEADIQTWEYLASPAGRELVCQVEACGDPAGLTPSALASLRELADADTVRRAVELVRARQKAARKIAGAASLFADVEGVEQASGTVAAAWKARRYADRGVDRVVDLCSGIGGDLIELRRALPDADVRGIDRDPVRAWMASRNAACETEVQDVTSLDLDGAAFHVDPARRVEGEGRRLRNVEDYMPGRPFLERLVGSGRSGALKLGPGAELRDLPGAERGEVEILGGAEGLLQAVVWCGSLAREPGSRTATRVDRATSFSGSPTRLPVTSEVGSHLLVAEPALERADLVAARAPEGLMALPAGDGWATADGALSDPWFRSFEVLEVLPWRERRLRAALRALDAGIVHVKVRGRIADANVTERALRGDGGATVWLFGYRAGERAVAVLARALAHGEGLGEDGSEER